MTNGAAIESPCTLVCTIDRESGWCLGCGRTGSEIAAWLGMTAGERRVLMDRLPERLARLAQPSAVLSPLSPAARRRQGG